MSANTPSAASPMPASDDLPAQRGSVFRLIFRATAIIEACTWVGMITALIVKYPMHGSPMGVTVVGWIHGIAWIAFVLACLLSAVRFRWTWWTLPVGLVMSVIPFLTIPFDIFMERTGRLRR